jgi:hypothetical protein
MLYLVDTKGVYGPEVVTVMGTAFDRVCQFLPKWVGGNDEVRQLCAWTIIRLVDQGHRDPVRLFEFTLRELTGAKCVASPVPKYPWMTA